MKYSTYPNELRVQYTRAHCYTVPVTYYVCTKKVCALEIPGTHTHTHSPRNDSHLPRVISSFEQSIQVPHNFLKGIAHEVQRAVGEDD